MDRNKDNWDKHWEDFGDTSEKNPALLYRHSYLQRLLSEFKNESPQVLLDIGCGTGSLIRFLEKSESHFQIIGLEPSLTGCESARNTSKAKIVQGDVLQFNEVSETLIGVADIAICSEVIEHVDDPVLFLQEGKRFLKSDGKLIVSVPGGPRSAFDRHIGHRRHFKKSDLEQILKQAGFTNVRVYRAGFPVFNLYKMLTILAGKKLISTVAKEGPSGSTDPKIDLLSKIFTLLFRFSSSNFILGWQLFATAEVNSREP